MTAQTPLGLAVAVQIWPAPRKKVDCRQAGTRGARSVAESPGPLLWGASA